MCVSCDGPVQGGFLPLSQWLQHSWWAIKQQLDCGWMNKASKFCFHHLLVSSQVTEHRCPGVKRAPRVCQLCVILLTVGPTHRRSYQHHDRWISCFGNCFGLKGHEADLFLCQMLSLCGRPSSLISSRFVSESHTSASSSNTLFFRLSSFGLTTSSF